MMLLLIIVKQPLSFLHAPNGDRALATYNSEHRLLLQQHMAADADNGADDDEDVGLGADENDGVCPIINFKDPPPPKNLQNRKPPRHKTTGTLFKGWL